MYTFRTYSYWCDLGEKLLPRDREALQHSDEMFSQSDIGGQAFSDIQSISMTSAQQQHDSVPERFVPITINTIYFHVFYW